jgi:hypothetical protein
MIAGAEAVAEAVASVLAHRIHTETGGLDEWTPSMIVALHLAAAYQASKALATAMPREQYLELVRAHVDTISRGAAEYQTSIRAAEQG